MLILKNRLHTSPNLISGSFLLLSVLFFSGCDTKVGDSNKKSNLPATDSVAIAPDTDVAQESMTYYTEKEEETNEWRLIVNKGGRELQGPTDAIVNIEKEADFNGDGVMDALVSLSGGGNCCASTYMFVSVKNKEVITSELEEGWADYSFVEENKQVLVIQKMLDVTNFYTFDGTSAVKTRTVSKLKAEEEINGLGAFYSGDEKDKTLKMDINKDGVVDEINCTIWPRWGSLSGCSLPMPGGSVQTLEYACDRIGVLATSRNGYQEIVCNNDTVIYFDGKKWITNH